MIAVAVVDFKNKILVTPFFEKHLQNIIIQDFTMNIFGSTHKCLFYHISRKESPFLLIYSSNNIKRANIY